MSPEQQLENELMAIALERYQLDGYDDYGDYDDGVDGLGFTHKRIKKRLKRRLRKVKRTLKNPVKELKKDIKRAVKITKKAAPYVAAAAAIYFGAPYALAAGKFMGAKGAGLAMMAANARGAAPQQMGPPEPADSMISPEVLSMAGGLARQALMRQGVRMQSPQAQQAVQRYVDNTAMRAYQGVVPGAASPIAGMTKYLLPAAAVVGAVLMVKG